jgi:D-sedoheptulose 7-phosphate isomerase
MKEVKNYIETLKETLDKINISEVEKIVDAFIYARDNNKQILVFGNGGSGSTASHMVCDILKGCSFGKEKRFRILSLNDNIPTILAYGNDVSYDIIFLEQLKNYLQEGDLVIAISGSGNSKNIINAIQFANEMGATTIGLTGFDGGRLKEISKISFNANINDMQISEDLHVILMHILYKVLNNLN